MKTLSRSSLKNIHGGFSTGDYCLSVLGIGTGLWLCAHLISHSIANSPRRSAYSKGYAEGYRTAPVTIITIEKTFSDGFQTGKTQALAEEARRARSHRAQTEQLPVATAYEIPIAYPA